MKKERKKTVNTMTYSQKNTINKKQYVMMKNKKNVNNLQNVKSNMLHNNYEPTKGTKDIENIFTLKDLEKNPQTTLSAFKAPSILDPQSTLSVDEEAELDTCMKRIGTDVRHRRLLIKPFFQDKDKSNSGFVSNTRFRSIFDNQKLWITDREYYLINKRFQAKAQNEINYVEFDHVMRLYSGDRE